MRPKRAFEATYEDDGMPRDGGDTTSFPAPLEQPTPEQFLDHLTAIGLIDRGAVLRVQAAYLKSGDSVCRLLSKLGILEERVIARELSHFLNLPLLTDEQIPPEPVCRDSLTDSFLKSQGVLPLRLKDETLFLATADPFCLYTRQAIGLASGCAVDLIIAEPSRIEAAYHQLYEASTEKKLDPGTQAGRDDDYAEDLQKLKDLAAEAPVIKFVNQLIQQAVDQRASDIHLEPFQHVFRVRFRIDGALREVTPPAAHLRTAIVSRIKLMAKMNIAERRLPQDGRIRFPIRGKEIDLRVATIPTTHGESVVLRILDKGAVTFDLGRLGFSSDNLARYLEILDKPTGIILVTGPTGSGKTTTLYASLLRLNSIEKKILTVEDPVEYELPGVNQLQVKPSIGLSFANALRSLVRQDPDIILVGEIRDLETAEIAGQAALTGHKVLSTLHTNDAASSVTRLIDMGIPAFLVTATLEGVVAQRLVRKLCPHCKGRKPMPADLIRLIESQAIPVEDPVLFAAVGCPRCDGTGYHGRTAIYEVLIMSDALRGLIHDWADGRELQAEATKAGMTTLFQDGLRKVLEGVTTFEDVLRVAGQA